MFQLTAKFSSLSSIYLLFWNFFGIQKREAADSKTGAFLQREYLLWGTNHSCSLHQITYIHQRLLTTPLPLWYSFYSIDHTTRNQFEYNDAKLVLWPIQLFYIFPAAINYRKRSQSCHQMLFLSFFVITYWFHQTSEFVFSEYRPCSEECIRWVWLRWFWILDALNVGWLNSWRLQ